MIRNFVAAACFAALAPAAMAADAVVRHAPVTYSDLDLSSAGDQAVLQSRVAAAARHACGGSAAFHSQYAAAGLFVRADFEKCQAQAMANADQSLKARGVSLGR